MSQHCCCSQHCCSQFLTFGCAGIDRKTSAESAQNLEDIFLVHPNCFQSILQYEVDLQYPVSVQYQLNSVMHFRNNFNRNMWSSRSSWITCASNFFRKSLTIFVNTTNQFALNHLHFSRSHKKNCIHFIVLFKLYLVGTYEHIIVEKKIFLYCLLKIFCTQ